MKKKVLFIVNPKSGKGSIRNKLLDIVDIFIKADFDLTLYISQSAGDARVKAKEVEGKYELIICSGGDGTLDEVISGVMECEHRSAIGYIPCGSTNDFAHSLKIPTSMTKAAELLQRGMNSRAILEDLMTIILCILQHSDSLPMYPMRPARM